MVRTLYHVTASANRLSIETHGLDWRHMGTAGGVAGHATGIRAPEREGIFLVETPESAEFFVSMGLGVGLGSMDIWEVELDLDVDPTDLDPESELPPPFVISEDHFLCYEAAIPRDRIRLFAKDRTSASF